MFTYPTDMSLRPLLTLTFLALPLAAQTKPKSTLEDALLQARAPLVLTDGKFSAVGADVLTQAVQQSRFVLVGEDHVTHEIPQFTATLCDVMQPDDYAVEAGPEAAQFVNSLLRNPNRLALMSGRNKTYPNNMAFLDISEENDLAAHCAASSRNPHFQLWGLDQEFLGAAGPLLEAMEASHPGPRSLKAIVSSQARDRAAEQAARASGDPGKLFLLASTDSDIQSLKDGIDVDGNSVTKRLLREFMISRTIYHLNAEGTPDANRIRAELLKRNFLADYSVQTQPSAARVLFKFGDGHTGKGFNDLHQRDLGNFVSEFADGAGAQSLHILVRGARGTHATFGGYAKPLGRQPFTLTDDADYKWLAPAIMDLLPQQVGNGGMTLTLFDLRKLRFRGIDLPPDWERVIYSYDLFVLIPELTPAKEIE